jgi:hypothetical protein
MFSSPFRTLSKNQELRLTLGLLFVIVLFIMGLQYLDQFLINDTCTGAINSFYFTTIKFCVILVVFLGVLANFTFFLMKKPLK